jgi:hypothetical protein
VKKSLFVNAINSSIQIDYQSNRNFIPPPTGVALPRETGEPGGGEKTIEQVGAGLVGTVLLLFSPFSLHFDFSNRRFLAIQVSNLSVGCVQRKFQTAVTY